IVDLEAEGGPTLAYGAVERRLVFLGAFFVERARVLPAHVGERLGRGLHDVDVVAVPFFGLVAPGTVVDGLRLAHLLEQAASLVLRKDVELASDHVGESSAPKDQAISR